MQNLIVGEEYLATHPIGWWGPSLVKVLGFAAANRRVDVLFLERVASQSGAVFEKGSRHFLGKCIEFEPYNFVLENV